MRWHWYACGSHLCPPHTPFFTLPRSCRLVSQWGCRVEKGSRMAEEAAEPGSPEINTAAVWTVDHRKAPQLTGAFNRLSPSTHGVSLCVCVCVCVCVLRANMLGVKHEHTSKDRSLASLAAGLTALNGADRISAVFPRPWPLLLSCENSSLFTAGFIFDSNTPARLWGWELLLLLLWLETRVAAQEWGFVSWYYTEVPVAGTFLFTVHWSKGSSEHPVSSSCWSQPHATARIRALISCEHERIVCVSQTYLIALMGGKTHTL